jgi:putative membrane protein
MKKIYAGLVFLSVLHSGCSNKSYTDPRIERANQANTRNLENLKAEKDSTFASMVTESGIMEIESGRLALLKTTNPDVKTFAQRMVDDHSKTNEELKSIAQGKGINLPVYINQENQEKIKSLSGKSGNDFDQTYIDMMVNEHQKYVDEFKNASNEALLDDDLRSYAKKSLLTLSSHLDMAKRIQDKLSPSSMNNKNGLK